MNIYSNPVNVNNVKLSDQRIVDTGGGNLRLREEPNITSNKLGSITEIVPKTVRNQLGG
ncbi:hypothetical protein [Leptospira sp. GIMC2001]|uniref:hypothetical protein n=1 Tax=Leptospira sp. GIMC2001 TaxID=1513297 RepID=UPI002349D0D8|nr:hypothetical protein [Leptospira sp. GIMC2001]WCL51013.1 hypothetical protein O4O04_09435 [Leptospira sp. GIMC2001]